MPSVYIARYQVQYIYKVLHGLATAIIDKIH